MHTQYRDLGTIFATAMLLAGASACLRDGPRSSAQLAEAGVRSPQDGATPDDRVAWANDTAAAPDTPRDALPDAAAETPLAADAAPVTARRKLDLLFVVDNSNSMREEQGALSGAFPAFLGELQSPSGELPDLHLAVVTTDMGAGPTVVSTCAPLGDMGRFQYKNMSGQSCALDPAGSRFLASGGTRNPGALAQAFACLANPGIIGCGYEHTLQALRVTLTPTLNPESSRFLRHDALLGLVILSDEDDCSADPEADFFAAEIQGQAASLRCALRGHLCNGSPPPAGEFTAPLSACVPATRDRSLAARRESLINVSEIVDFVIGLKQGKASDVYVAVLAGWSSSPGALYRIGKSAEPDRTDLDLLPICTSQRGSATPAVRLKAFADAFGANGLLSPICDDLAPPLRRFARMLAAQTR